MATTETRHDDTERPAPARADANSRLALVRTRLSHDRTMLSWIRTATSLITFGFGVHQVFRVMPGGETDTLRNAAPYHFGSAMVVAGLLTLVLAALGNRAETRELARDYPASLGYPPPPRSYARILGALIGLLGIGALIAMHV